MPTGDYDYLAQHLQHSVDEILAHSQKELLNQGLSAQAQALYQQQIHQQIHGMGMNQLSALGAVPSQINHNDLYNQLKQHSLEQAYEQANKNRSEDKPYGKRRYGQKFHRISEEVFLDEGDNYKEPLDRLRIEVARWLHRGHKPYSLSTL